MPAATVAAIELADVLRAAGQPIALTRPAI